MLSKLIRGFTSVGFNQEFEVIVPGKLTGESIVRAVKRYAQSTETRLFSVNGYRYLDTEVDLHLILDTRCRSNTVATDFIEDLRSQFEGLHFFYRS